MKNVTIDTKALEADYKETAHSMMIQHKESLDRLIDKTNWNIPTLCKEISERISLMWSIIECASEFGLINYASVQELTSELLDIRIYYDELIEKAKQSI